MGRAKVLHSKKERLEIAEKVCELYATNEYTIESCCNACGITSATFIAWQKAETKILDLYNIARKKAKQIDYSKLVVKMKNQLEVMAMGECPPLKAKELIEKKDADGNVLERIEKSSKKEIPANVNAAITLYNASLRFLHEIETESAIKETETEIPPNIIVSRAENDPCAPLQ